MKRFLFKIVVLMMVLAFMSEAGGAVISGMVDENTTRGVVLGFILVWSTFTSGLLVWVDCYLLDGPEE